FWTATAYNEDDKTPIALIGQYSLADPYDVKFTSIRFNEPNVKGSNQPQIIRTPDGYIHVFIGVTYDIGNPNLAPGKLRYYRSEKPEDISTLIDRTELIPTEPYSEFHLRMNVGISSDGDRMALVILAVSADGKVPFNTPVVFFGKRQGLDFIFQNPMSYEKQMGFFYPQVAVTNEGVVIVGEVWDKKGLYPTRLIHIDYDGKLLHTEDIFDNINGAYFSYDMKPKDTKNWDKLIIYYVKSPEDHNSACHHEFWEYDTIAQKLKRLNSLEIPYSYSNAGKWISVSDKYSVFINNPSMGQIHLWEGDILGGGEIKRTPIPKTNPFDYGYQATAYIFTPNVLQGSLMSKDGIYFASDCFNKEKKPDKSGPCSFLLWRLVLKHDHQ
ncbi:MAG: hypothetical protein AAB116_26730, partial [Candidatus Poribacteria bacterium]